MSAKLTICTCILTVFCSGAGAITIPEFSQIVSEVQQPCATGRFVYTEAIRESNPPTADSNTPLGRIQEINRQRRARVEAIIDRQGTRVKTTERDLRDIGRILEERQLKARDRANLDQSQQVLTCGTHVMYFFDQNRLTMGSELALVRAPGPIVDKLDLARLGCIAPGLTSGQWDTTFSTTQVDGQERLLVKLATSAGGVPTSCVLECDPALGYRYRKAQVYANGTLRKEEVADDYRDVGGIPYPHKYQARVFDATGTVLREVNLTFEKVELNQPVSDDDFTISAPAGTRVVDLIISGRESVLESAEKVSIQSILNRYASQIAMAEMQNVLGDESGMRADAREEEITIPPAEREVKRSRPFVLDLDRTALLSAAENGKLDWDQINHALVTRGEGDLAWNDELVLLRGASLVRTVEGQEKRIVVKEKGSCKTIQIPGGSPLPVRLVVRNERGKEYSVRIMGITSDGIRVACKLLKGATK